MVNQTTSNYKIVVIIVSGLKSVSLRFNWIPQEWSYDENPFQKFNRVYEVFIKLIEISKLKSW